MHSMHSLSQQPQKISLRKSLLCHQVSLASVADSVFLRRHSSSWPVQIYQKHTLLVQQHRFMWRLAVKQTELDVGSVSCNSYNLCMWRRQLRHVGKVWLYAVNKAESLLLTDSLSFGDRWLISLLQWVLSTSFSQESVAELRRRDGQFPSSLAAEYRRPLKQLLQDSEL